jgi:F-type H+-transporting ATPase subunit b
MMVLDPVAQLHPVAIGAVVAIFLATFAVLRRTCVLPLLDAMERRAARLEAARALRAAAEVKIADAQLRAKEVLDKAHDEAARITGAARQRALRAREERLASGRAEAEAVLARGRDEIAALRRAAQARLAEDLCACAGQVLARMAGRVDERTVRFLVDQALAARQAG